MRSFLVERSMPGIGSAGRSELAAIAEIDNKIVAQLEPDIQWLTSYIAEHKTYCLYLAKDEETVHRHSELAGFPADRVVEVKMTIGPATSGDGA